jgi:phosphatidylglycerophosphate synthase
VRRSYSAEKRWSELQGELPAFLIYRPLSFYLALPLLRLRVPVLAVTLASGGVALGMIWVAWRGGPYAHWGVAALGFAFHVLDCVDGNMARTTGQLSKLGGLLDGFIDMVFWCLLFLSIGLLVEHAGGGVLGGRAAEIGLGLAVLVLLNRATRESYAARYGDTTYFRSEIPEHLGFADRLLIGVVGLESTYVYAIALGGHFGVLDRVLVGIAVYVLLIFFGALYMTFAQAVRDDEASPR